MRVNLSRNCKLIPGAKRIEIAGKTATVEVETGSELDGLLYYNATRDGRPRLGLHLSEEDRRAKYSLRFQIKNEGGSVYRLEADRNIES